jgi:hypothetical protein
MGPEGVSANPFLYESCSSSCLHLCARKTLHANYILVLRAMEPCGVGGENFTSTGTFRRPPEYRLALALPIRITGLFFICFGEARTLSFGAVSPRTHGCSSASSAVYRRAGSTSSKCESRSLADGLKFFAQRGYRS